MKQMPHEEKWHILFVFTQVENYLTILLNNLRFKR